jgi:CelD/BcsL family acetyltransferase involved in cellulose biosynthesis
MSWWSRAADPRALSCVLSPKRVLTASDPALELARRQLDLDDPRWLRFLDGRPEALPFHRPAWLRILRECYGFTPFVLALESIDGELAAALPMLEVRDPFRGRRWIGLPFTDRCPPLVASPEAERALGRELTMAAAEHGVGRVEVRSRLAAPGLAAGAVAVQHLLDLTAGADALERGFSSAARRNTRKARRSGLEVRPAECEEDIAGAFYGLHVRTRRRLGVPVQPRRFFRLLWRLGLDRGLGHGLLVFADAKPVAGAIFLLGGETLVYKYGASDERAWPLRPNNLLFAEAIRRGCELGLKSFDFGRSNLRDAGLRRFKASWGARESPLVYTRAHETPRAQTGSVSARAASAAIRRAPAWLGVAVGEALYRYAA